MNSNNIPSSKEEQKKLKEKSSESKKIKKQKNKTDKQRASSLKNWIQHFIYFLFVIFAVLILGYVLGLFFPSIRTKLDMTKIEQIIINVFTFILGTFLSKHISNILNQSHETQSQTN